MHLGAWRPCLMIAIRHLLSEARKCEGHPTGLAVQSAVAGSQSILHLSSVESLRCDRDCLEGAHPAVTQR